jgi:hypothetical protein
MAALVAGQYKHVMDVVTTFCRKDDQRLLVYFCVGLECDTPILEALFFVCLARVVVKQNVETILKTTSTFTLRLFELFYLSLNHRGKRIPEERKGWREVFLFDDSKIVLTAESSFRLQKCVGSTITLEYEIDLAEDGSLFAIQHLGGWKSTRQLYLSDKLLLDFPNNKQW